MFNFIAMRNLYVTYIRYFILLVGGGSLLFFAINSRGDITISLSSLEDHNINLCLAPQNSNVSVVPPLLRQLNNQVNQKNKYKFSCLPIYYDSVNNHLLAHQYIKLDTKDLSGNTLLYLAAQERKVACIKLLLDHGGFDVNAKNNDGCTPLDVAVNYWDIEIMHALLQAGAVGASVKIKKRSQPISQLHWAVIEGKVDKIKKLLDKLPIQVNSLACNHYTPLHYAVQLGNLAIVSLLLKVPDLLVNAKTKEGYTALHLAIQRGDVEMVKLLLGVTDILINEKTTNDHYGYMALHLAIKGRHLGVLSMLLKQPNIDLNVKIETCLFRGCLSQVTPLHIAAYEGYIEVVKMFLENPNVNVNIETSGEYAGWTPLHLAAARRHIETVNVLLAHKNIDVNANNSGHTPLHDALTASRKIMMGGDDFILAEEIVKTMKLLLVHKAIKLDTKDLSGNTLLHLAAEEREVACVKLLLDHGDFDVNVVNNHGDTPLDIAANYFDVDIMDALLKAGAVRAMIKNNSQNISELHWAVIAGKVEKIKTLLTKRAIQVNALAGNDYTPLHCAAQLGNAAIVSLLLKVPGILLNAKTENGYTALHLATKKGHKEIVKLLVIF